ncbi:MIR motif-containing protein [Glomus cerebriforme]|uniref:MIR motif-containing protein n=1 Tax=Glomus cerebriforme TaxID=658196 RepID=A0A397T3I3_9GLOM|nr:MIR motif-containing protein [Glomus cerebriforme]
MGDLPPRYDGTLQPEVWVQDLRFFCALRGIHDQTTVLNIAILRIDHNIPIPKDIASFDSLIHVLKNHVTHTVFRADSLEKLNKLKCERNGDMSKFIIKFLTLCSSANITNPEEKKYYLLRNLPDDIVRNLFRNRIENLDSFDEMIEIFKDVMLEHRSQIRYGSKIALKHIATGRFLSSTDIKYETGLKQQMVFCNGWQPDKQHDFWIVIPPCKKHYKPGNPITFNSVIGLKHQKTGLNLHSHSLNYGESPITKQQEVTCYGLLNDDDNWVLKRHSTTSSYDDSGYWMVGDIISLRHDRTKKSLSSHDFMINNGYQEVTCHADGHEENHKWCVEVLE